MYDFLRSSMLLFMLLNPFLLIIYLADILDKLTFQTYCSVMVRAGAIALVVFVAFAALGEAVFQSVIQARFESFQVFGGIVFLLIGLQFVFYGRTSIELLRGESVHLGGAIAMPILIGPGTISASVIIGERLSHVAAGGAIALALGASLLVLLGLKLVHDYTRLRQEQLVLRYIEIVGRLAALYIGTVAVEMILVGLKNWQ